ncbi:uncharacterized protein LOC100836916 isoform X4 [Brachypodium distachyon]|uniref:uncharacterized protein LOC100836916 isoform X4 n=1 Tax=Brachypodium distachyon TaxID=15368 RepID=UPI000D0E2FFA|nr:uncharacterized protein LOC100836916 isoform X4 [Brachypodium distachyon]|eukprot:XP_024312949.1 uncharacterized protein LOC100836916 isoform X4 [Brachypodium distachyon]
MDNRARLDVAGSLRGSSSSSRGRASTATAAERPSPLARLPPPQIPCYRVCLLWDWSRGSHVVATGVWSWNERILWHIDSGCCCLAADYSKNNPFERDVEQAIAALKKGTHLLKYGRRGKPKFCLFRLSNDETMLIWYSGRMEKQLNLIQVSKIIPGQRTAIFLRYPRPDKEYQSFSLIYGQRSLDLICKDKDEAEAWFVGLKALISGRSCKWPRETKNDKASYRPINHSRGDSPFASRVIILMLKVRHQKAYNDLAQIRMLVHLLTLEIYFLM